jgi:hypothetical protein
VSITSTSCLLFTMFIPIVITSFLAWPFGVLSDVDDPGKESLGTDTGLLVYEVSLAVVG